MKTKKGKPQDKRSPSWKMRQKKRTVDMRGKWRPIELDPSLFSEEGLEGLVCFEELTNYRLVDSNKVAARQPEKQNKKSKKRKVDVHEGEEDEDSKEGEDTAGPAKKKVKKKKKVTANMSGETNDTEDVGQEEDKSTTEEGGDGEVANAVEDTAKGSAVVSEFGQSKDTKKKEKRGKKKKKQQLVEKDPNIETPSEKERSNQDSLTTRPLKKQVKNWASVALSGSVDTNCDVSAWKDLFVPPPVLKALSSLGFGSPTPIQALALPPAIRDRMDVLGAAETGSGKTLAFGIPMIHTILEWKNSTEETVDDKRDPGSKVASLYLPSADEPDTDEDQDEVGEVPEEEDDGAVDQIQEDSEEDEQDDEDKDQNMQLGCVRVIKNPEFDFEENAGGRQSCPLLGLVLTPTRELAVQVKHHIDAVAKFTDIKTAIVVGGMAQQKQRRVLNRRPEIIIATPGRLWDLVKEQHPHLANLKHLKCLVIDEADRMVERGHFAELENLLEMLTTTHFNPTRQTFVFSATLTMVHSLPTRLVQKKRIEKRTKLEILMEKVGIKSKPKVIDLTRKEATVETLTETKIHCQKDEKDFYLYYFLLQYPGRTMVFANSIDCIKRLNSLLVILDCTPLPLHANMHQKQRLKNLERFAERESSVLLTTDVAARGLDIPDVQHVIHYQVPRTSETYVHRSGRTARATKEGLSLLLVGPDDMINFKKIYRSLGKDEELPVFPIETKCMEAIKERVNLGRSIEKIEFYKSREKQHNSWFKQAAEALEVELEEDLLLGGAGDEDAERGQQKLVKDMKKHLKRLISQHIFKNAFKTKYPTQMGKLSLASIAHAGMEDALTRVSAEKKKFKKGVPTKWKKQKQRNKKQ